jgi:hypothetical protein
LVLVICNFIPSISINPVARAESEWSTNGENGFNGTGSSFDNCSINGSGVNAWLQLNVTGNWFRKLGLWPPDATAFISISPIVDDNKILLFGGSDGAYSFYDQTWLFDVNNNTWTQLFPSQKPSPRAATAMAPIWNDDKVILFGGFDSLHKMDDTWIYDLSDNEAPRSKLRGI